MIITLKNWYQVDFELPADALRAKETLLKIESIMSVLKSKELESSWFFLYEGATIRIRIESPNEEGLKSELERLAAENGLEFSDKLSLSPYQESDEMMPNEAFVESFAKIMSEVTTLTISKLKEETDFENYRTLERIHHCMFNNLATLSLKSEEHFLQQRLSERLRKPFDNDFENKV